MSGEASKAADPDDLVSAARNELHLSRSRWNIDILTHSRRSIFVTVTDQRTQSRVDKPCTESQQRTG